VCATCEEHFTRRYSVTRHNLTIHDNRGEIVTYIEYLVGRNSGRYRPSHPSLYRRGRGEKRNHNFAHATTAVTDSRRDTFMHGGLQQQGQYHHYPQYQQQAPSPPISLPSLPAAIQDVSSSHPMTTTNNQGILSNETILKIQVLKKLVYSYPHYCPDPEAVIKSIVYFCTTRFLTKSWKSFV
jgi:hypothetical protein